MINSVPTGDGISGRVGSPASSSASIATGVTIYGCQPDEAAKFRALAPRVGARPMITAEPVSAANAALASGTRCISVDHRTRVTAPTLRALSRSGVQYISTRSVGSDHIDLESASSLGISVGNVAYSPDSVADYTVMLILMVLRHADSIIGRAAAHDYRLERVRGRELRDLTVGVVGTGRIGTAVMERLRGFGCRLLANDNRQTTAAEHVPFLDLLRYSDIVTLHTPLNATTHHLLDRERIGQLKPGVIVINTGRGAVIDTDALIWALETGRIGGAALDVVEGEDGIFGVDCRDHRPENSSLLRLHEFPNVIISPHSAYHTDHALRDTVENSLLNCLEFEARRNHGQVADRHPLRRSVRGTSSIGQVGAGGREKPGSHAV